MNTMMTSTELSSSAKKPCWRLGLYRRSGDRVSWREFSTRQDAEDAASQLYWDSSRVLFDENDEPTLFSGVASAADVAVILYAHEKLIDSKIGDKQETRVDKSAIDALIQQGELPIVPTVRPHVLQWLLKRAMELVFHRYSICFFACGPRRLTSLYYFDAQRHPFACGHVALTLDDAPCRFSKSHSRLSQVLDLMEQYGAHATFMVISKFISGHEDDLVDLLKRGHELGNHGSDDRRHDKDSPTDFLHAVDECSNRIQQLQAQAGIPQKVKWFRAPHGKYTAGMEELLQTRNLQNVMCDTYASCPIVQDGEYIGNSLAKHARDGSILLLHMPERGFRDWCLVALERLLEGLHQRGIKVVTVSELERLANKK